MDTRFNTLGSSGDFGGDLVVHRDGQPRTVVQAKRWSKEVGLTAVREALAAKGMYDCAEAMVVTNSTFTWRARKLANANAVVLWDRAHLISLLESTNGGSVEVVDVADRSCARCGEAVSERVRAYCLEHRTVFGGLVYCFPHQKEFRRKRR